jgi:hypothetical protein
MTMNSPLLSTKSGLPPALTDLRSPGAWTVPRSPISPPSGTRLYGGFVGNEGQRRDRNPERNETILSGDLLGTDNPLDFPSGPTYFDNVYHVMTIVTDASQVTVLSGFTITAGIADLQGGGSADRHGGGVACGVYPGTQRGSAHITRCKFIRNHAVSNGGALVINGAAPAIQIVNCEFALNTAFDYIFLFSFLAWARRPRVCAPQPNFTATTLSMWRTSHCY